MLNMRRSCNICETYFSSKIEDGAQRAPSSIISLYLLIILISLIHPDLTDLPVPT